MWRDGCPRSPDWDSEGGEIDDGADEKEGSEYDMWNLWFVLEGLLWVSVRVFLVPDDVLCAHDSREVE